MSHGTCTYYKALFQSKESFRIVARYCRLVVSYVVMYVSTYTYTQLCPVELKKHSVLSICKHPSAIF